MVIKTTTTKLKPTKENVLCPPIGPSDVDRFELYARPNIRRAFGENIRLVHVLHVFRACRVCRRPPDFNMYRPQRLTDGRANAKKVYPSIVKSIIHTRRTEFLHIFSSTRKCNRVNPCRSYRNFGENVPKLNRRRPLKLIRFDWKKYQKKISILESKVWAQRTVLRPCLTKNENR